MDKVVPLPPNINKKPRINCTLEDFVCKSNMEIEWIFNNMTVFFDGYIENIYFLTENFELLKKILKKCSGSQFQLFSRDYRVLEYLEKNLGDDYNVSLLLIDDFQNTDRSNIDATKFERFPLIIPFFYALWGAKIKDGGRISTHTAVDMSPFSDAFSTMSLEDLRKSREIITALSSKYSSFTDCEKIIAVSDYIQDSVQYVGDNNISETSEGTYITDSKGMPIDYITKNIPFNALFQNYGVCGAIAQATTLLLNNPEFNINIRGVMGSNHYWNVVLINGRYYYVDNTWCITRNKDRYPESLKAKSFSSDYLLFGYETAERIGHHIPSAYVPLVTAEDFSREKLNEAQKKLVKHCKFNGYNYPIFSSKFEANG